MSYRPQSPDITSYPPQQQYRPTSPDISGLSAATAQASFQHNPLLHSPPFAESAYRGSITSFEPSSVAAPPPQPHFGIAPPYSMASGNIKEEDDEYMPDTYARRSTRNTNPYNNMPANGSSMGYPQAQQIKQEAPQDPTHGVVLKTSFPVARIKRIMQADEDIGKVAQVTPHAVSRALELFMIKLITASADQARGGPASAAASKGPKRVLAQHLKRAIQADETFDFLTDIIAKVPDAPASKKKEAAGSDSEEAKLKPRKGKKRKDSGDDI
jgi:hypothetical protein